MQRRDQCLLDGVNRRNGERITTNCQYYSVFRKRPAQTHGLDLSQGLVVADGAPGSRGHKRGVLSQHGKASME